MAPDVDQGELLAQLLMSESRLVIVDLGLVPTGSGSDSVADARLSVLAAGRRSTLVTRACYLAVRAATERAPADDMVLVLEPGRALRSSDVTAALGVDDITVVRWDVSVARAVDAGLLGSRLPRPLRRVPRPHGDTVVGSPRLTSGAGR